MIRLHQRLEPFGDAWVSATPLSVIARYCRRPADNAYSNCRRDLFDQWLYLTALLVVTVLLNVPVVVIYDVLLSSKTVMVYPAIRS